MSQDPAFGLVEESTMNKYAAPYTPGMPFFTVPTNSEPPYSSYSVSGIQPDVSSMYYYDSGYAPYVTYCPDFPSSPSIPPYNPDWYMDSPPPAVGHDWYSENEDPAISYYPPVPSFDNNGFYPYGSCHYPEQVNGEPYVSSTVITTTPWESRPPTSTAATTGTDFCESLPTSSCGFYSGCENQEDKQTRKLQEEGNSTASIGHYLDDMHTAGRATESSMEVNQVHPIFGMDHSHAGKSVESSHWFKQVSSSWQENASTTVGIEYPHTMPSCLSSKAGNSTENFKGFNFKGWTRSFQESASTTVGTGNSHAMPTSFDFEGSPTISPQKDIGSYVHGPFSRKLQESNELFGPSFAWTASYADDTSQSRENISLSRPMSSASDAHLNLTASYLDDASVPRPNFSVSRLIGPSPFLLESSLPTLPTSFSLESSLPTSFSLESSLPTSVSLESSFPSLPTLLGNYDKYKSPKHSSPQSTTQRAPIDAQETKGKPEDARGIKLNIENIGNRVSEGTSNPETSFGCRTTTKKAIHFPAIKERANHVLAFDMKPMSSASPKHFNDPSNCANQSLDVPVMNDMFCNDLSSYQEMDFHTKRMEDFLANCSKGGEFADDALVTAKSDEFLSYPTQNASAACHHGPFSSILDSSDCHPPKPIWLLPESPSKSASSFSTSQFVEGTTSHGVSGSSKLLHSSLKKTTPIVSAPQIFNESNGSEEMKPCQSVPLGIDGTASVECTQFSFGNTADFLSENKKLRNDLSISSKEVVDVGKECNKLVHTMNNLSVVLLASSSTSDNIRESDVQVLESVICNLSQCLLKRMGLSTSTVGIALEPEKPVVSPSVKRAQKACKLDRCCSKVDDVVDSPRCGLLASVACSAVGGKEIPVERTDSFQISAEAMQAQMVNIEAELDLMKFEIRCLKMKFETERLTKSYEGALKFGDSETSANTKPVNNWISPDVNLGIKGNGFNNTEVPISQERDHGLPDLNLNPVMDSAVQTDATIKYEDIFIFPNESYGESIVNSSLMLSDQIQKTQQPDAETGTGQIEDSSGSKLNMGCISGSDEGNVQCTNKSSLPESKDGSQLIGQHEVPLIILASLETDPYFTDVYNTKSNNYIHNSPRERDSHLEDQNGAYFEKHTQTEILNAEDSNFFIDDRCQTGNIFLEDGATIESPKKSKSVICTRDLENVDDMHISKEVSCFESESGWELINDEEDDYVSLW